MRFQANKLSEVCFSFLRFYETCYSDKMNVLQVLLPFDSEHIPRMPVDAARK